ncbi:hypothetical protein GN958_ATG08562 [Phytophthora infestans]|uniref:Uncharacterized protein n=1 Tax=Phytophthora infestans TaxID=4787 RepID=A0A8S9UNK8_PHYIN|nr:hypothetical protein GN958_ATG08562 [Phytophthora infestans]
MEEELKIESDETAIPASHELSGSVQNSTENVTSKSRAAAALNARINSATTYQDTAESERVDWPTDLPLTRAAR